jgi:hypothetical protein
MIRALLKFTAFVALLATCFVLSLMSKHVRAAEVEVRILFQQRAVVRTVCADQEVPDWGCVTWKPALDDATNFWCVIHIPIELVEVERNRAYSLLRPQCDAPAMERGAGL